MIKQVTSDHKDFKELVNLLDSYLALIDGEEHSFYNQYNSIENLNYCIVYYEKDLAVGCGAIKQLTSDIYEVKRMYVLPQHRSKGIASEILAQLEKWALDLGASSCLLETGKRMPDAIALYKKRGYAIIPNYGQYIGIKNSVCFEKIF